MDLKIPYVAVKSSKEAFKVVEEYLSGGGLAGIPIKPNFQFMPEKNLIIAEGSGFKIRALFEPEFVAVDMDLSFLYKAFKGKFLNTLEQHLKKKL